MAAFTYSAINSLGAESAGQVTATDLNGARELLRQRGLRPVTLSEIAASGGSRRKQKRVKTRSLQVFSRQFATMIDAGLNVVASLVILEQQTDDKALAAVLSRRSLGCRGRNAAVAGDGATPERLRPPLHLDDRGGRGSWDSGHRPRPRRDPDREGDENPPPREGGDDLPARRWTSRPSTLIGMLLFLVPVFQHIFSDLGGDLPTLTKGRGRRVATSCEATGSSSSRRWGLSIWGFRRWKKTPPRVARCGIGSCCACPWGHRKGRLEGGRWRVSRARSRRSSRPASTSSRRSRSRARRQAIGSSSLALADVRAKVHQGIPIAEPLIENPVFPPLVSARWSRSERRPASSRRCSTRLRTSTRTRSTPRSPSLTSIIEPLMMMGVGVDHRDHRDRDVPADVQAAAARAVDRAGDVKRSLRSPPASGRR